MDIIYLASEYRIAWNDAVRQGVDIDDECVALVKNVFCSDRITFSQDCDQCTTPKCSLQSE